MIFDERYINETIEMLEILAENSHKSINERNTVILGCNVDSTKFALSKAIAILKEMNLDDYLEEKKMRSAVNEDQRQ